MRDEVVKHKTFTRRAFILGGIKLFFLSTILGRYYYLQGMKSDKYSVLSENNRLKIVIMPALRGKMLDKNGIDIVSNSTCFRLVINAVMARQYQELIPKVEKILGRSLKLNSEVLRKRLVRRFKNDPLTIEDNLDWEAMSKIAAQLNHLEGVDILESISRKYFNPEAFSTFCGYLGSPTPEEVTEFEIPSFTDIKTGKAGLEKKYDAALRGEIGYRKIEVDVHGSLIREIISKEPIKGQDLQLNINAELQVFIHNIMKERELNGAVIVLEAKTGNVLALYSAPTYDANEFVDGISYEYWQKLTLNGDNPFINNAVSEPYPPGSTFKLVTALAALRSGIDPKRTNFCSGYYNLGSRTFKCAKLSGHGNLNMFEAISRSCNPYFYWVSQMIGIKQIAETARLLGLGEKTGIDIPYEHKGLIPDPAWKKARYKQEWYKGDTVNSSIGQGFVLATPMQIAQMTARIASGRMVSPSIVKSSDKKLNSSLLLNDSDLQILRQGMKGVVNEPGGTVYSKRLFFPNFIVAGKTGTAQVVSLKMKEKMKMKKFAHHALFTSFAPFEDPKYVVTVLIEHGEAGPNAAPIAKEVYGKLHEYHLRSLSEEE